MEDDLKIRRYKKMILNTLILLFLSDDPITISDNFTKQIEKSVENGLEYLAKTQNPDGSWTCKIGYKLGTYQDPDNYRVSKEGKHVGVSSLACMAFMSAGHYPDRGKYSTTVKKALEFVLSCVREDGYITFDGSRMYSHAFSTLFLTHVYGMTHDKEVKEKLKMSVNMLVQSQNKEGGWRYQPQPIDADLSVTVSVVQALRAARNVGISVPKQTVDKAMEYIKSCSTPDGFQYQSRNLYAINDDRTSYALTACGIVSYNSAGQYLNNSNGKIQRDIKIALNRLLSMKEQQWGSLFYFYGHYYACQAMYAASGKYWEQYSRQVFKEIIGGQKSDGSWEDIVGKPYATSMALIILQVPNEQFPIFQR
ncbi:MAG: terpene cyclase/mutase family protein [Planctomycetes bacterium]|nr:terpene cyclase/mutase family protein [Planctomycetota bacterium]